MKFTSVIVAALATVASAKPKFTMSNLDVVAGQPFELKWTDAKGPVTIELLTGTPPDDMHPFSVLATAVSGTSFTVTIPKSVPSGQYAFTVADGPTKDDTNFSGAFSLVGTGTSSSSSVASTTSGRSTSSSATSSATTMTTSTMAISNSTTTTSSSSIPTRASSASSSTSPTTTGTIPNSNSSGNKVQSSLALVMLGAVAYAFLN